MTQREQIIAVAVNEIGYREGANNATKYGAWYGMNNQPWCAMFVSWCARQAGVPMGVIPNLAYVPYIQATYDRQGAWMPRGSGYSPLPGDLVIFGKNDHIGIVEGVSKDRLITIEGNTSASGNSSNGDGVYRRSRSINDSWIKGYCVPAYSDGGGTVEKVEKVEMLVDGEKAPISRILREGENYVNLREFCKLVGAEVDYDEHLAMPVITTSESSEAAKILDHIVSVVKILEDWRSDK